jgi:hypothetical protein
VERVALAPGEAADRHCAVRAGRGAAPAPQRRHLGRVPAPPPLGGGGGVGGVGGGVARARAARGALGAEEFAVARAVVGLYGVKDAACPISTG